MFVFNDIPLSNLDKTITCMVNIKIKYFKEKNITLDYANKLSLLWNNLKFNKPGKFVVITPTQKEFEDFKFGIYKNYANMTNYLNEYRVIKFIVDETNEELFLGYTTVKVFFNMKTRDSIELEKFLNNYNSDILKHFDEYVFTCLTK